MIQFKEGQRIKTRVVTRGDDHLGGEHTLQPGASGFIATIEVLPVQGVTYTVVINTRADGKTHIVNVFDEGDGDISQFIVAA